MAHSELPPELLFLIARYFNSVQAIAPSLVCRVWYHAFCTVIWHTVSMNMWQKRSLQMMTWHADHIRKLLCLLPTREPEYLGIPYSRLTRLVLRCTGNVIDAVTWNLLIQLVKRNVRLEELTIYSKNSDVPLVLWESLASLPCLHSVTLSDCTMDQENFSQFWKGCKGVQRLYLSRLKIRSMDGVDVLPNVERLHLDYTVPLALLRLCPNVRSISWISSDGRPSNILLDELAVLLNEGLFPRLDGLHPFQANDIHLASCLTAMRQMKELELDMGIETLSLKALPKHFCTLERLQISHFYDVPGEFVAAVMASCPLLTDFSVFGVKASKMMAGPPWVCLKITTLRLWISTTDSNEDAIRKQSCAIFERLSKLTQLRCLDLRNPFAPKESTQGLDLRLESGLGQLASLTRLVTIDFSSTIQNMSAADVAWMRKTWRNVEATGHCNSLGSLKAQPDA
ncbi:hypothetical protein CPC16_004124 [Podila verticillata]|nr:hypothetical protein CPC16_004124 [Podila verticillata]